MTLPHQNPRGNNNERKVGREERWEGERGKEGGERVLDYFPLPIPFGFIIFEGILGPS